MISVTEISLHLISFTQPYPHLVSQAVSLIALQKSVLIEQLSRAAERRGKCKTLPLKTAFFAVENCEP